MSRRVILGAYPPGVGSGFGLRVAQPGQDAASTSESSMSFSSDWPAVLPVHVSGQFQVNANVEAQFSFPDLGYTPFASFLFNPINNTDGSAYLSGWNIYGSGSGIQIRIYSNLIVADYTASAAAVSAGYPSGFTIAYMVYRYKAA